MSILKIINTVEKLKEKNMIKLATISSVCPDWTLNDVVTGMKRHWYQGFEPRVEWGQASGIEVGHSGAQRKEVRAQMEGGLRTARAELASYGDTVAEDRAGRGALLLQLLTSFSATFCVAWLTALTCCAIQFKIDQAWSTISPLVIAD